ncbi:MAG TPA: hypothetical protein VEF33_15730, partial [Syntrophales bacterium]|nr:hypothetical protein [Syntrophales bacterium]
QSKFHILTVRSMKLKQKHRILIIIFLVTFITALVAWLFGYNPNIVICFGILISLIFFALWDPPPKHKDFSDRDRLEGTNKARGNPPPELWRPDMPIKSKKLRKKK